MRDKLACYSLSEWKHRTQKAESFVPSAGLLYCSIAVPMQASLHVCTDFVCRLLVAASRCWWSKLHSSVAATLLLCCCSASRGAHCCCSATFTRSKHLVRSEEVPQPQSSSSCCSPAPQRGKGDTNSVLGFSTALQQEVLLPLALLPLPLSAACRAAPRQTPGQR
jgi:hypothetical protein